MRTLTLSISWYFVRFMHLSVLSPREGGRDNHKSLIVRSVPRVGILIVCDVPRLANLRTFYYLHLSPGGHFDKLFCPRGVEFEFFLNENVKIPTPCPTPPPWGWTLIMIGALHSRIRDSDTLHKNTWFSQVEGINQPLSVRHTKFQVLIAYLVTKW